MATSEYRRRNQSNSSIESIQEPVIVSEDDDLHAVQSQKLLAEQSSRLNPWRVVSLYQKGESEK